MEKISKTIEERVVDLNSNSEAGKNRIASTIVSPFSDEVSERTNNVLVVDRTNRNANGIVLSTSTWIDKRISVSDVDPADQNVSAAKDMVFGIGTVGNKTYTGIVVSNDSIGTTSETVPKTSEAN